jgi:SMC interacting uncharacterized protein involved in chromosome segregation
LNPEEILNSIHEIKVAQAKTDTTVEGLVEQVRDLRILVDSVHKLALSVENLTGSQKNMSIQLNKLQSNVDDIQNKPAKRLDAIQMLVIGAIVTGVIGFLMGKFLV